MPRGVLPLFREIHERGLLENLLHFSLDLSMLEPNDLQARVSIFLDANQLSGTRILLLHRCLDLCNQFCSGRLVMRDIDP